MNVSMTAIMTVMWFSAGVSSAVAAKLASKIIDCVLYTHIDDQHPDTLRFVKECEGWFGKPVERLQSPLRCVENACRSASYVNGPRGAACTTRLKRRVRKEWEKAQSGRLCYVWGLDATETHRAERIKRAMPEMDHIFPLIDDGIRKAEAHKILKASGLTRPAMYELGYRNNNCVGCVKGGKGYWNKIRRDFPGVFAARAGMERAIGATCINGVYLDELDPEAGRQGGLICDDCGLYCELMSMPAKQPRPQKRMNHADS